MIYIFISPKNHNKINLLEKKKFIIIYIYSHLATGVAPTSMKCSLNYRYGNSTSK